MWSEEGITYNITIVIPIVDGGIHIFDGKNCLVLDALMEVSWNRTPKSSSN